MIDPTVRPATAADVGPLLVLEAEARAPVLVDARGGSRWLEEHPAIGGSWADVVAALAVFVAVLDVGDEVPLDVGYLVLDVEGPLARVDQVYITPDAANSASVTHCWRPPPRRRSRPAPGCSRGSHYRATAT